MKKTPLTADIESAEDSLRDSERVCGRDPDNMPGDEYCAAIQDALASNGFLAPPSDALRKFLQFPR